MRNAFIVAVLAFLLSPNTIARNNFVEVKAKEHSCEQLQEIVSEQKQVRIKGFGSADVFAIRSDACSVMKECVQRKFICEEYKTKWRTTDKFSCVVGYACRAFPNRAG